MRCEELFFLPTTVKLQFFKTFLLPHFDYCITLSIYYTIGALQKLVNCYYMCLSKLFNFNLINLNTTTINAYLKRYNLFAIQHRILYRFALFLYKLTNSKNFPLDLSSTLKHNKCEYNFRHQNLFLLPSISSKSGEQTFEFFFVKFINNLNLKTNEKFLDFKTDFFTNVFSKVICFIILIFQ